MEEHTYALLIYVDVFMGINKCNYKVEVDLLVSQIYYLPEWQQYPNISNIYLFSYSLPLSRAWPHCLLEQLALLWPYCVLILREAMKKRVAPSTIGWCVSEKVLCLCSGDQTGLASGGKDPCPHSKSRCPLFQKNWCHHHVCLNTLLIVKQWKIQKVLIITNICMPSLRDLQGRAGTGQKHRIHPGLSACTHITGHP